MAEPQASLASFPEQNPNPVVEADLEGTICYANPAALRLFPDLWEQGRLHPWLADWPAVAKGFREGKAGSLVRDVRVSDRSYQQSLLYDPKRGAIRIYGLDITSQKQAVDALMASQEQLSLAVEQAGMATWDVDLHTGRAVWSRRLFEMLGYPPAPEGQATLEMLQSRIHPADHRQVAEAFDRAQREHGLFCPHPRILRLDNGQVGWLRVFARFLYDEVGQPVRLLGVVFDDTPLQEAVRYLDARQPAWDLLAAPPLGDDLRATGIEVIGAVPWGTHFCQFYATRQDLVETLVPYFRAGLEANEFCMWVTSQPLQVDQAMAALRVEVPDLDLRLEQGQIEILDYSQWYLPRGRFDADEVLQGWTDKLADARQRGFQGLRLTGNTFWLEQAHWEGFTRYEEKVNQVIGGKRMLALCTYSLEKCGVREIMDVVANHQFALIKRQGRWESIESAEHKKMEQALRESEERLRLAVWASDLGVFEWDPLSDRVVFENQRMADILGLPTQESSFSKSRFLDQVIHPEDAALLEAALAEGMRPGRLFHTICRILRLQSGEPQSGEQQGGELRWIEASGRFEHDAHGAPVKLVGVVGDITERKRAQDTLQEHVERLRLYAEQLQHSNQALEDFAFIASHDLREPLRKIQTFGNMLKSHSGLEPGGETRDYLERMLGAVGRMQEMLDGLLAYSRVTTQGHPFTSVDLRQVVAEALSDLEVRLSQTGGHVELGGLPVIQADRLQMRQLLQNLIGNALKFYRPGVPPRVVVSCQSISEQEVMLVVEDNGIGFEERSAGRIFEPFVRLNPRSEYEGTGMGLAICKKIVDRHQGTISARSIPGKWTTFTVTLPVRPKE